VTIPATSRITLKTVRTFARTMLHVERLVGGGPGGGFAARRREASASVRPRWARSALAVAVRGATLADADPHVVPETERHRALAEHPARDGLDLVEAKLALGLRGIADHPDAAHEADDPD
jgi:hypothetical protein